MANQLPRLTPEQQKMVATNMGLARQVAWRFADKLDYEEALQLASIGLIRGIAKYDPTKGFAISSCVMPFIKGEIQHFLRDRKDQLIRTPRTKAAAIVNSLDVCVGDSETTHLDLLAAEQTEQETSERQEAIQQAICYLEPEMQDLLIMRFFNQLTRIEIAEWLEVHQQTIYNRLTRAETALKQIAIGGSASNLKQPKKNPLPNALPFRDDTGLYIPPFKTRCVYCDRVFGRWEMPFPSDLPRYCSRRCSASKAMNKIGRQAWTQPELELLKELVGTLPRSLVVERFQAIAKQRNFPKRSDNSIIIKINRKFNSTKPVNNGWTMPGLAEKLGIEPARVKRWSKRGLRYQLLPWGHTGKALITKADLTYFAQQRPDLLAGIDVERLSQVLDDRALAESCSNHPVKVKRREIQRLDNRKIYPSAIAAARDLGIHWESVMAESKRGDGWLRESRVVLAGGDRNG